MTNRDLAEEIYRELLLKYVISPFAPDTTATPTEVIRLIEKTLDQYRSE